MKRYYLFFGAIWILVLCNSCSSFRTIKPDSIAVVKEIDIPKSSAKIAQFATHTYVDYRLDSDSDWYRVEVTHPKSGVRTVKLKEDAVHEKIRWNERVRILSQTNGQKHSNLIRDIRIFAKSYDDSVYRSYPGPNSNTFIEKMTREVDGLSAQLDHNAIGKEIGFHFGKTSGGTGIELQTPVLGVAVGLKEGVELNVIGLSAGLSFWPPSLRVPFLPRIPTWE